MGRRAALQSFSARREAGSLAKPRAEECAILPSCWRIAELIALQKRDALDSLDVRRRIEADQMAQKSSMVREYVASGLVRIGMLLDHDAGERALVTRGASR